MVKKKSFVISNYETRQVRECLLLGIIVFLKKQLTTHFSIATVVFVGFYGREIIWMKVYQEWGRVCGIEKQSSL